MARTSRLLPVLALLAATSLLAGRSLADAPRPWRQGDDVQAAYIAALQHALPAHGYKVGPLAGKLDPITDQSIKAYQAQVGLSQDTADAGALKATLDRLTYGHTAAPPTPAGAPATPAPAEAPTQPAPAEASGEPAPAAADPATAVTVPILDAASIRQAQDLLKAKGYDLEPTGTLDVYTENAVKAFQLQNNLPPDGRIDGNLLDLLKR